MRKIILLLFALSFLILNLSVNVHAMPYFDCDRQNFVGGVIWVSDDKQRIFTITDDDLFISLPQPSSIFQYFSNLQVQPNPDGLKECIEFKNNCTAPSGVCYCGLNRQTYYGGDGTFTLNEIIINITRQQNWNYHDSSVVQRPSQEQYEQIIEEIGTKVVRAKVLVAGGSPFTFKSCTETSASSSVSLERTVPLTNCMHLGQRMFL